jgi:hypothetical protein
MGAELPPRVLLIIFFVINVITYFDRGALAVRCAAPSRPPGAARPRA